MLPEPITADTEKTPDPFRRRVLAWLVHIYTGLGLMIAAAMAVLIVRGDHAAFWSCFVLMLVATLVDATDGTLARLADVKHVLPNFDGRRLDDIIDFLNYAFLPLLLIWRAEILPEVWSWLLLLPLAASAYGFCQVEAKTDDGFFLGFPSYWNFMAFYLYMLRPPVWAAALLLIGFALLTFVPSRYLYPSQAGRLNRWTNYLGATWTLFPIAILVALPPAGQWPALLDSETVRTLTIVSLYFPAYYLLASWFISLKLWLQRQSP